MTKHRVHISQRVDRFLLRSCFEQTRQILQIRLDTFGTIANQHEPLPKESPILKAGLAVMLPIALQLCCGAFARFARSDLMGARRKALEAAGVDAKKQAGDKTCRGGSTGVVVRKRPAQQPTAASSASEDDGGAMEVGQAAACLTRRALPLPPAAFLEDSWYGL